MQQRIGVIGCGGWGKLIVRDLKALGCHVSVVAGTESREKLARATEADSIVPSIDSLNDIHGLVVATQTSKHTNTLLQAAQSHPKVPIFVEKPIAPTVEEATMIAEHMGDRLFVMDKWRYHDGVLALKALIRDKTLGSLQGISLTRNNSINHHPDVDMIWTCMPHDMAIMFELLGYFPELQSAVATQWGPETMSMTSLWGKNPWVKIEVSTIREAKSRVVRVECENGMAILRDGYAQALEIYRRLPGTRQISPVPEYHPFTDSMPLYNELEEFLRYLKGGVPPKSDAAQGLATVRAICEARAMAGIQESGVLL